MALPRELRCPQGCDEDRFEAVNAPLYVDRRGRYLSHDSRQATYVCGLCGHVALDIAAAAREMQRSRGDESGVLLVCPGCGTRMLPPEDDPFASLVECPACELRFPLEEGIEHLHQGSEVLLDDDIEVED